ncbi:hypothetical protein CRE_05631 [Caenorhabditis remanei]|uniref:CUB-like domain-containing protein n=1 Tax=Caenorhabditis remanei TaxID=31234 RepID=E3M0D4_CAERE|nr:hypothetical protein CRE_05631 [Caenorhabditis remanei]
METRFFVAAVCILFFGNYVEAVDFTCPTNAITRESGVFPKDVLTLTTFPHNYNCNIKFQIEDGFVFQFTLVANVTDGSGESLVVTDALGKQLTYNEGVSTFFAPAKTASISITTKTGGSQFWFRYNYVPVAQYEQTKIPTGTRLSLVFSSKKVYTFVSPYNDNVLINTATVDDINNLDMGMKMIYVYDGIDINSPYVGTLYDYVSTPKLSKSTGNATTLVNFYGTPTNSYALANDYKSLISYDTFTFVVYTKNVTIPKNFADGISNVYTFYCTGSDKSYLTDLNFGSNGHKVDVRPLTPSDTPNVLLAYVSTGPVSRCMPQMIPGRIFTMVTLGPEVSISLSTSADNWLVPYNGRLGYVFSSSLWYPGAGSGYNYTFESAQLMTFTFNFQSAIVHQAGEQIRVQVGRPGYNPISVTFDHSVANPGVRVANGTYLTTSYLGDSPASSSIISFQMVNADGTQPTTVPMTTTAKMETTTKFGFRNGFNLISVFIVFAANLL